MSYNISYIADDNLVLTEVTGILNKRDTLQFFEESLRTANENNCKKILFDTFDTVLTEYALGFVEIAKALPELGYDNTFKIAIIHPATELDNSKLFQSTAKNAGLNIFMSSVIVNARKWINEQ